MRILSNKTLPGYHELKRAEFRQVVGGVNEEGSGIHSNRK